MDKKEAKTIYRMDLWGYASLSAMFTSLTSYIVALAITGEKRLLVAASISNGVLLILCIVSILIAYKADEKEGR